MKIDRRWLGWAFVIPIRFAVIGAQLVFALAAVITFAPVAMAFAPDGYRLSSAWVPIKHVLNLPAILPWWPWQDEEKKL